MLRLSSFWRKLPRMNVRQSFRGFGLGVLVGLLVGSTGVATAALGYKGWERFSKDFLQGYIVGFMEMSNLARNLHPGGWVDQRYPYGDAKSAEWYPLLDEFYKDPKYQGYTLPSLLGAASTVLAERHNIPSADERARKRFQEQLMAAQKRAAAEAAKTGASPEDAAQAGSEVASEKAAKKAAKNAAGGDSNKVPAVGEPAERSGRKWCRCDGKDPKVERLRRRAKAEAEYAAFVAEMEAKAAALHGDKPTTKGKGSADDTQKDAAPAGKPAPAASVKKPPTAKKTNGQ